MNIDGFKEPLAATSANTIARIADSMGRMRLLIGRRYISRLVIDRAGTGMELSHLDLLLLVHRLEPTQEITVGTLARHMNLDHSRASRIVAELVKRGLLRRGLSQEDARRSLVVLTPNGNACLDRMREIKHETMEQVLSEWSREDLRAFADLFDRFVESIHRQSATFDHVGGHTSG
jgi:DNA-binding MarR family transcriptional regulator